MSGRRWQTYVSGVVDRVASRAVREMHAVTSPDFVREADDFFQRLADRHGAEYDGWEASA